MGECELLIKLIDVVQVSAKILMDFKEFFDTDGPTRFIDNLSSFLNIDPSKIKIAKITQGSVIIDFVIIPFEEEDSKSDEQEPIIVNSEQTADEMTQNNSNDINNTDDEFKFEN